jgi:hypothetical protein
MNAYSLTPYAKSFRLITDQGNLRAFVDVQTGPFTIRGVRIIQQEGQRAYANLPQQQGKDGRWFPIVECADPELATAIKAEALRFWGEQVGVPQ